MTSGIIGYVPGLNHFGESASYILKGLWDSWGHEDMGDSDDDISLADFEVAQPDPIPESRCHFESIQGTDG